MEHLLPTHFIAHHSLAVYISIYDLNVSTAKALREIQVGHKTAVIKSQSYRLEAFLYYKASEGNKCQKKSVTAM